MLTLIDLFEIKDVRAAIELYWQYDDEYLAINEPRREAHERERLGREIERLRAENANMLKEIQDMAKKNEHVKSEVEEIVERLGGDCQWPEHQAAKNQASTLQGFLG